jgi:hypothetical protein
MAFSYDFNNFLNPTRIEFILMFSFFAYMITLIYQKFIAPNFQGYFDPEQEKKIKQNKERQAQHHKELVELMSALAKSAKEEEKIFKPKLDEAPNSTINEEPAKGEQTSEGEQEKKKKKKKKAAKKDSGETTEASKVKAD